MSRHKHSDGGGQGGVQLGMIITPMLDMAFQILAFFIMTYHPSALEGHIPGSLAPQEQYAKKGPKDNTPSDPLELPPSLKEEELMPELNDAIQIKIKSIVKGQESKTRLEGYPSQVFIKLAQDSTHQILADVDVDFDVAIKRLEGRLTGLFKAELVPEGGLSEEQRAVKFNQLVRKKTRSKASVKLEADNDLRQQFIMQAYDTCKLAGYDKIYFVPPPVLNTKFKSS